MNWEGWSRDAASLMKTRTRNLMKRYALGAGDRFEWDLEASQMTIGTSPRAERHTLGGPEVARDEARGATERIDDVTACRRDE